MPDRIYKLVASAVDRAMAESVLGEVHVQKLLANGDKFRDRIVASIMELSGADEFADEEVESSYTYPEDYKVHEICQQIKIIHEAFPEVKWGYFRPNEDEIALPDGAEGLFAIPRWEKIAPTYGAAVERVLAVIASKRKFYNYHEGELGAEYLRQHAKTAKMFQKLGDEQKDFDILVVPAQFGLRHKGRSVRRAREVFAANEFGLGAFAIGIMLLTHPEHEVQWEQLHVDCAGDEFTPDADGDFSSAPLFDFYDGRVRFYTGWLAAANGYDGSASAFLPVGTSQ